MGLKRLFRKKNLRRLTLGLSGDKVVDACKKNPAACAAVATGIGGVIAGGGLLASGKKLASIFLKKGTSGLPSLEQGQPSYGAGGGEFGSFDPGAPMMDDAGLVGPEMSGGIDPKWLWIGGAALVALLLWKRK